MKSDEIFAYSKSFLDEIIADLIKSKIQNLSNPQNSEFNIKLKKIFGKNLDEEKFKQLILLKDNDLKKIIEQFNNSEMKE